MEVEERGCSFSAPALEGIYARRCQPTPVSSLCDALIMMEHLAGCV
jgi:hypothetical protein